MHYPATLLLVALMFGSLKPDLASAQMVPGPAAPHVMPPCCQGIYSGGLVDEIETRPATESLESLSRWLVEERLADAGPDELSKAIGSIEGRCSLDCPARLTTAKFVIRELQEARTRDAARRESWGLTIISIIAAAVGSLLSATVSWLLAQRHFSAAPAAQRPSRFYERFHRED